MSAQELCNPNPDHNYGQRLFKLNTDAPVTPVRKNVHVNLGFLQPFAFKL